MDVKLLQNNNASFLGNRPHDALSECLPRLAGVALGVGAGLGVACGCSGVEQCILPPLRFAWLTVVVTGLLPSEILPPVPPGVKGVSAAA